MGIGYTKDGMTAWVYPENGFVRVTNHVWAELNEWPIPDGPEQEFEPVPFTEFDSVVTSRGFERMEA